MLCLNCYKKGIPLSAEICPKCGVHLPLLMRDVLPHQTLLHNGHYRLDYALGRGGFGITYQATHTALDQLVAIKEFYPREHALRQGATGRLIVPSAKQDIYQRGMERFLREGKTLAKLNHPNIVQVWDFFEERGTAYLVMELITGSTLGEELEAQPGKKLPPAHIEKLMNPLVDALTAVHQQGIYHLDIKPDNIMLTPQGRLVLVDFGASRQGLGTITTQAFTPDYAPPEVIAGTEVGADSDLFELGMMLHEILTGKLPPSALNRLMNDDWFPQGLDEPWQGMVTAALQIRRQYRPRTVQSWWETLLRFKEEQRQQEAERQRQEVEQKIRQEAEEQRRQEAERQRQEAEQRARREAEEKQRKQREKEEYERKLQQYEQKFLQIIQHQNSFRTQVLEMEKMSDLRQSLLLTIEDVKPIHAKISKVEFNRGCKLLILPLLFGISLFYMIDKKILWGTEYFMFLYFPFVGLFYKKSEEWEEKKWHDIYIFALSYDCFFLIHHFWDERNFENYLFNNSISFLFKYFGSVALCSLLFVAIMIVTMIITHVVYRPAAKRLLIKYTSLGVFIILVFTCYSGIGLGWIWSKIF